MIHRTIADAIRAPRPMASWKELVTVEVTLSDGRTFYRSYEFNATAHQCKRCRNATRRQPGPRRIRCRPGHYNNPCTICGNPYYEFTRRFPTQHPARISEEIDRYPCSGYHKSGLLH